MKNTRKVFFAVIAFSLAAAAQANFSSNKNPEVRLNPDACKAVPADKSPWIPDSWSPYRRYVKICAVTWHNAAVLYVISIWADEYYGIVPPSAPAVKFPKSLLLSTDGKKIGEFPELFPRDPPRTLEPIFTRWSGNFPHEVKLWLDDPAVLGDRFLPPLEWDQASGEFVQSGRKEKSNEHVTNQH